MADADYRVMVGPLDDPATYRKAGADRARGEHARERRGRRARVLRRRRAARRERRARRVALTYKLASL